MRTLWSTHARSPRQSKFLKASPPGPRRHNRSIRAAGPTPSQTPRTPLFRPSTSVARPVHPTCPQTPRSQHSDSWPHPLTDTAHSAFDSAHLRCAPDPAQLPPDARIAAFGQLAPPPHKHRTLRFSRRPPLQTSVTPPAPRGPDCSILIAGPTPSHTPQTPLLTPPTYVARLVEIEGSRQLRTFPQIRVWSSGAAAQSFFGMRRLSYSQCNPNFAFDGSGTAAPDLIGGCYTTARLPAMGSAFRETSVT